MQPSNQLSKAIAKLDFLPPKIKAHLVSSMFGLKIKFFATAGIKIVSSSPNQVTMVLKNRRKVQNHLQTVHAAAMSLLAESATGFVFALNLPDDKLPLVKEMNCKYIRRAAKGPLTAVAKLSAEQINSIKSDEKGEVLIEVEISDSEQQQPLKCSLTWAWIPKKR